MRIRELDSPNIAIKCIHALYENHQPPQPLRSEDPTAMVPHQPVLIKLPYSVKEIEAVALVGFHSTGNSSTSNQVECRKKKEVRKGLNRSRL